MSHYDEQREAMEKDLKKVNFKSAARHAAFPISHWYDYGRKRFVRPPLPGEICEFIESDGHMEHVEKVKVIGVSRNSITLTSLKSGQIIHLTCPICTSVLRPLDWKCKSSNLSVDEKTISLNSTNWYDYDKQAARALPPIGENCQYTLTGNSWFDCVIVSHNKLVINCPHLAEDNENGNGLQCVNPNDIEFRPIDWDKNSEQQALSAEVVYHLSNAFNELNTIIRLLPESDPRHAALVGVAGAVNAVREVA